MEGVSDRLEVKIIQARGLKDAPNGELPTPYVEVDVGPDSFRTRHLVETKDPYWNSATMSFHSILSHNVDQILIKVRHKDIFSGKDVTMGVVAIPMATYYGSPKTEIVSWAELLDNSGSGDSSGSPGRIQTRITYFNELDEDVQEKYSGDKPKAPNLLEVTVVDAKGLAGGRATEPFVVVQIGDLKKESRVAKKSTTPSWEDTFTLPVTKGDEMIDITVKQSALLRSLFLGRICIPMNEVAAAGDTGLSKSYQLLNELLILDQDGGNGEISLKFKWYFDEATDAELKKKIESKAGMLARLKKLILRQKDKPDGEGEDSESQSGKGAPKGGHTHDEEEEEKLGADDDDEYADMTPYEYSLKLEEQRRKRRDEMEDLLQVSEDECELKNGDYCIQVNIIEVIDIAGKNMSGLSDPFVLVEVMGQKQKTNVVWEKSGAVYDDWFYFNFKDLRKEQIQEAHLKISVFDYNRFAWNVLIGIYQVDLISVYAAQHHEFYRRTVGLRDPLSKEDSGIQGTLRFTCTVLGPGDEQKLHDPVNEEQEAEQDLEHEEGSGAVDIGQGGSEGQELNFLVVSIQHADGLPGFDKLLPLSSSGLYCFVTVDFGGCKPQKTTKVSVQGKTNLSVKFEEEIWIPVWTPTACKRAALTIWHREFGRQDLVVATAYLDFGDIQKCENDPINTSVLSSFGLSKRQYAGPGFQWIHFYGANPKVRNGPKAAYFMNRFPNYGSAYRGSAMVATRLIKRPRGPDYAHKKPMNYHIPDAFFPKGVMYMMRVFMLIGSDFGSKGKHASGSGAKYAVAVSVGPYEIRSTFKTYENGSCEWLELQEQMNIPLPEMRYLPDTFITVYKGTETNYTSVSYTRLKTVTIMSKGLDKCVPEWYDLRHDQSHRSTNTAGFPGSVLMKLSLMNVHDLEGTVDWEGDRKKLINKDPYKVRVYVYQCRKLPAAKDNALIDPYVKVRFCGKKVKTEVRRMTQYPDFYDCLEFDEWLPSELRLAPNMLVQVWDSKSLNNFPIGAVRLPVADIKVAEKMQDSVAPPAWYTLMGIDGKKEMGEVLLSFWIYKKKSISEPLTPPKDIVPRMRHVWIDIHVLGVRILKKIGFTSNRRPFLQFDMATQTYGSSVSTKPSRLPSAMNPNYQDRYVLDTNVPEDPMFAPALEIRCFDRRMGSDVIVGAVAVELASKMPWNGAEYVPPRQHYIMKTALQERKKAIARRVKKEADLKKKAHGEDVDDDDGDDDKLLEEEKALLAGQDEGVGPFPPGFGDLPRIIDQEEEERAKLRKKRQSDPLNLLAMPDMAQVASWGGSFAGGLGGSGGAADKKREQWIRKNIGFPSTWANTEFMKGREWWIQSKKKGEGGKLEDYMKTFAFENYDLFRGHIAFNRFNKRKNTLKKVGMLKAVIRVCLKNPRYDEDYGRFARTIKQTTDCYVRCYVIRANNLMPCDTDGKADPYLQVSLGDKLLKDKSSLNDGTLNPEFFTRYDFETKLPGPSILKIQVYDANTLRLDVLMAETEIDLEDRWYHPKWNALDIKPVENRTLAKADASTSQGVIMLWVDIFTKAEALRIPATIIEKPSIKEFEIRVVCWRSLEIPNVEGGGVSDIYVQFNMEGGKNHYTDTHWRCKNGRASWNWRIKIPIELPIKSRELGRLKIQAWKRNIITPSVIIGEGTVELFDWLMLAYHRQEQAIVPFKELREAEKKYSRELFTSGATDSAPEGMDDDRPSGEDDQENQDEDEIDALDQTDDTEADDILGGGNGDDDGDDGEGDDGDDVENPLLAGTKVVVSKEDIRKEKEAQKKAATGGKAGDSKGAGEDGDEDGEGQDENGEKKKKKEDDDKDGEEDDINSTINTIKQYLGLDDAIADDGQWIPLTFHDRQRGRILNRGRLAVTVHIVPKSEVDSRPVGTGRDEPNANPFLPPPFGRFSFSFNPLSLLWNLCDKRLLCLCCCICCCVCVCGLLFFVFTYLSGIESMISLMKSDESEVRF